MSRLAARATEPSDSSPVSACAVSVDGAVGEVREVGLVGSLIETSKPRITRMVTITSGVGFVLPALSQSWTAGGLALAASGALAGTALSAAGANSLNQWMERGRDALMPRTCGRPLPEARVSPWHVLAFGLGCAVLGVLSLWVLAGPAPALVSLATIVIYLALYTPSKVVTPLSTLIGAVPGALPPLIGWSAGAGGGTETLGALGGWMLVLIMFVWQIPHFLAIAWLYRDDYAKGGYRVLAVVDPTGSRTSLVMLAWTAALVAVSLAPALAMPEALGLAYVGIALVTGGAFLLLTVRFAIRRTRSDARLAFIASVIHLPLLLMAMVAEAILRVVF